MNLRTLKKLSKRAAPLLPLLGDTRGQFPAERDDNYTGLIITDRKHWERMRSVHPDLWDEHEIKTPAKDGNGWIRLSSPCHPRKGTIMVGALEGYYEPEWYEKTAWEALQDIVFIEFTEWGEDECSLTRRLNTPSDILRAAESLVAARQSEARR